MEIRKISLALFFAVLGSSLPATAQHQITAMHDDIEGAVLLGGWVPRWTNDRLAGCEMCQGAPILYTVDRTGNRETVTLDIAESSYVTAYDVAAGADGSIAAVGSAISGDSRTGTFIVWVSPDRSRQVVTRVWPFAPHVVAVAPDGTIWAVGAVGNDSHRMVYPNVLRHYAPSGQLLTSTIVVGAKRSKTGVSNVGEASTLMTSTDRVGWLTSACQYLEFSSGGVELGRYNCPAGYTAINQLGGSALSPSDDLVVGAKQAAPLAPLELDRATGEWKAVPVLQDSGKTNEILGFDGLTLITRAGLTARRYAWSDRLASGGQI
jgi:hypothetical protein